ncbi:MAG TPA: flagellar hook-length control protein FliK [Paenibacillaceae bacterium]
MRADMSMVLAANATVTAIRQDVASTGGSAPQTEFARMLAGLLQGGAKADGAVGSAMTLPAALWWILAPNAGHTSASGLAAALGLQSPTDPLAGFDGSAEGDAFLAALREWADGLMRLLGLAGEEENGRQTADATALPAGMPAESLVTTLLAALGIGQTGSVTDAGPFETLATAYGTRLQEILAALAKSPGGAELAKAFRLVLQQGQPAVPGADTPAAELQQLAALAKSAGQGNFPASPASGEGTGQLPGGKAEAAQTPLRMAEMPQPSPVLRSEAQKTEDRTQVIVLSQGKGEGEGAAHLAGRTATLPAGAESPAENGPVPIWVLRGLSEAGRPEPAEQPPRIPVQRLVDQLAPFLVKKLTLQGANGVSEARISLHPEHLGHVDIRLSLHNGVLTAQFITATGMAKEMLEAQIAQLKAAIQTHGLQVERMEVIQQSPSGSVLAHMQHQGRQQGSGDGRHGTFREGRGDGYREAAEFEAAFERSAILQDIYGSSINLTA